MSTVKLVGTPVTLWCLDKECMKDFEINIGTDNYLYDLRKLIKEKTRPRFDNFDLCQLILWHVNVDFREISNINDILSDENKLINLINKVEKTFSNIKGKNIRVVIGVPDIESSKRQYSGDNHEEEQSKNVKKIRKYPSPSSFALINNLYDYHNHEQGILIYRPSNCIGILLMLYNSAFSHFKTNFNDEDLPMDKDHYQWTLNCIRTMANIYSGEKSRQEEFRERLEELFIKYVKILVLDKTSNNGCLDLNLHSFNVLYLLIEIKNEIGTVNVIQLLKQPLSMQNFMLKKTNNVGDFIYKEKLFNDPQKLLWKAETKKGQKIIVKFSQKYNDYAHKVCYEIGKAPELFFASNMINGFYMIIMGYVEGQKLYDCDDLDISEYQKIIDDIEVAISHLHSKNIVFADLHDSNILVIKDENKTYHGMLIDFDWAGENDVECYPSFMNPDINWPMGAEDNMKLKKEHDMYWLDVLKKST
ncbi:proteinkinasesubdomain-containingproteinpkl/ ccin9 [Gigaspora margarita]|uniref:Proteinkinasesubdomain-containingproteinpkl/ ccin9 n=1 Tax=Gigaspora margarita TaxID=4874 RepID=A0A8H4B0P2_GIGMA|nr:proteinkinasesubdomain-containingproteinpkl/ ccin9 [Gigaspora margarita]